VILLSYLRCVFKQALQYIGEKVSAARAPTDANRGGFKKNTPPMADAAEILANLVLNHVPVVNFDFRGKVCLQHIRVDCYCKYCHFIANIIIIILLALIKACLGLSCRLFTLPILFGAC
jgi:hypothetical protein